MLRGLQVRWQGSSPVLRELQVRWRGTSPHATAEDPPSVIPAHAGIHLLRFLPTLPLLPGQECRGQASALRELQVRSRGTSPRATAEDPPSVIPAHAGIHLLRSPPYFAIIARARMQGTSPRATAEDPPSVIPACAGIHLLRSPPYSATHVGSRAQGTSPALRGCA